MTSRTAAKRYARALFDVALKEDAGLEAIEGQLAAFSSLVGSHEALSQALLNPVVPAARKRAAVAELTKGLLPVVSRLLVLMAERARLALLPNVLEAYRERLLEHRQVVRADVTTAVPLAPERVQEIERGLAAAAGRAVILTTRVDPSLIGGIVARVGSTVYDGSLTTQLAKMKQQLMEERHGHQG